jgi:hypothetical protein
MSRWKLAVVLCCVSICVFAAADPLSGQWKLNPSKSKLLPPLPQRQVSYIEADATLIRIREEITSAKGAAPQSPTLARSSGLRWERGDHEMIVTIRLGGLWQLMIVDPA